MVFVLNYFVLAWTEPKQNPPADNVPAPLNVGTEGQQKAGGLILNTGNATTGLIVLGGQANPSGGSCSSDYQWYDLNSNKAIDNGECIKTILAADRNNVGIGMATSTEKLGVKGNIFASGDVCNGAGVCLGSLSGSLILVPIGHTRKNCTDRTDINGRVATTTFGGTLCRMNGSSCPTGWQLFRNYTKTTKNKTNNGCGGCEAYCNCQTGEHDFSDAAAESCNWAWYYLCGMNPLSCCMSTSWYVTLYATIVEVGCY